MAEFKGKKVTLNKPRNISKGSPGYGKKQKEVFVMDGGRVKRKFQKTYIIFSGRKAKGAQLEGA